MRDDMPSLTEEEPAMRCAGLSEAEREKFLDQMCDDCLAELTKQPDDVPIWFRKATLTATLTALCELVSVLLKSNKRQSYIKPSGAHRSAKAISPTKK
jgi:hypothetical protein